jgi:hypothetical protein
MGVMLTYNNDIITVNDTVIDFSTFDQIPLHNLGSQRPYYGFSAL